MEQKEKTKTKTKKKKKKKEKSRSFNPYSEKTQESPVVPSSSPRFLSLLRSKLSIGKELKLFLGNLRRRKESDGHGAALQARCQKTLQEPEDSPLYRSKHWKSEGKVARIGSISVSDATLLPGKEFDSRAMDDSARKSYHVYDPPASSSGMRSYGSKAAYEHERSDSRKEWLSRDKFPVTGDSDMLVHGRTSAYSTRLKNLPPVPFYPASPSKQRNHHQLKHFWQYEREGWPEETSSSSSIHFSGETTDARFYHLSGQSPVRHFRHQQFPGQSFYDYSSSFMATPHRSTRSEHPYPVLSFETESSRQRGSCSDMNGSVKERTPVVKRHVLPTAGGAPFITCYYCSELLQLSQEFLHCKKKRYLVRCGCCSGVLKFSPNVLHMSPSSRDDSVTDHREDRGSASVDHEESCPDKGHLSCSDKDCGDSVCKSKLSNDDELVSLVKPQDAHPEHSQDMYENPNERSETCDAGEVTIDGSGATMEDMGFKNEETNETTEDKPVSDRKERANEDGSTCETQYQEEGYSMEKPQEQGEYGGERTWRDTTGNRPGLHLEEHESNYELKDVVERVPTFRLDESELGKLFRPGEAMEEISDLSPQGCLNDKISSKALESNDNAKERVRSEDQTKPIEPVETEVDVSKLCLDEQLGYEEETSAEMLYPLDLSRDMLEKLKQTLEPRAEDKENRSDFSSRLCSDDHESSSKMIKLKGETTEPGDLSEQTQYEDDKSGLTFEPFAHHLCNTTKPIEIVGLRHALYTTQSSPLRSPMSSPLHSPMASPLHSHIVSPLRSSVNSSPSLSDVLLFFSKRFDDKKQVSGIM